MSALSLNGCISTEHTKTKSHLPPPPYSPSLDTPSWWYWKECPPGQNNTWLHCKGAVELWEPRTDVFHDGFNFKAPKPLALHNRWFSGTNNTYITQLGFADSFIVEKSVDFALPIRSDVFKYLMGKAKDWGMVLYEQVSTPPPHPPAAPAARHFCPPRVQAPHQPLTTQCNALPHTFFFRIG